MFTLLLSPSLCNTLSHGPLNRTSPTAVCLIMISKKKKPLGFLDIPPEVRAKIYPRVFEGSLVRVRTKVRQLYPFSWTNVAARNQILLTCKTIHEEAGQAFLRCTAWQICDEEALAALVCWENACDTLPHIHYIRLLGPMMVDFELFDLLSNLKELIIDCNMNIPQRSY